MNEKKYAIKISPNYYEGQISATQEHILTENDFGESPVAFPCALEFDSRNEAQAKIDELSGGTYYLAHGEADRPSYEIIDLDDDYGDDCQDASGCLSGSDWTEITDHERLELVAATLDALNVEYSHRGADDCDIYTEVTNICGVDFAIAFCPTSLALQCAGGDLGALDWDHASYWVASEHDQDWVDYLLLDEHLDADIEDCERK